MKKVFKFFGLTLLVLLVLGLVGFVYINSGDIPYYEVHQLKYHIKSSEASVERGKKLAAMLCANCHKDPQTGKLTGARMSDAPPEFGEIHTPNITQDKTYGIGEWTDAELLYLLRTGIKRDGQYAPPYMAKLPTMADSDINAIISFLRSNDSKVVADPTPDQPSKPSFLTKLLCRVAWKPFPMSEERIELPDSTNTLELGRYLSHNLDCFSCHSVDFKTNDFLNPPDSEGYFGGGNKMMDLNGNAIITANLTPDNETGIGRWNKQKFITAVKYGQKEGENSVRYPMSPYPLLSDVEVGAIFDYLQTIPPIKNKVVN